MKALLQILIFLAYLIGTAALAVVALMFCALFFLYRARGWPEEPGVGNCWSYAIPVFLRNPTNTYLVIDLSNYAPVPHVRFAKSIEGLEVQEFKPLHPKRGFRGLFDSFWFRGHIRKGLGE
jgi:hypothetical protein